MKNKNRFFATTLLVTLSMYAWAGVPQSFKQLKGDSQSLIENVVQQKKSRKHALNTAENATPDAQTYAYTWGSLDHEDGMSWYFTQSFVERKWSIDSSEIVIYDNNFEEVGTLNVVIPEDMDVNDIQPVYFITSQFFDTDASTLEIPVFVHAVDNGNQINKIYIYNLAGEVIQEYDYRSMIYFEAPNGYRRVIMINEINGEMIIDLLCAAEGETLPTVEHSFVIDMDLLYYNNGPALSYYVLDGKPYYSVSHFEKPCMDGFDMETFVPIQAPDNYLVVKTYNQDFEMLDSLRISIDPTDEEAYYGFASLGMFTNNDVRLGEFSGDNQRNYIITHYDYYALSDEFSYYFRVYDQDGNLIKTIFENTNHWFGVSAIEGEEEQMVFLKMTEQGQVMEMINIPSCQVSSVFPAIIDGNNITTTLDRYPVGDDYQYVIGLSQAYLNEDGDAIARIGWYNRDASVDHYVEFNIGKNAEGFTPYIANYVLNPYLFNTDDKREYFYLAMNKRTDGSEILDKVLYLADEDGKVLRTIKPEEGNEIEFSSGDIFDYNTAFPKMVLSFYNGDKDAFEILFYNLPFDKFTGIGDGTQANPYVITTPGELGQMHTMPAETCYTLGNDIDMSQYSQPYVAPQTYTGVFDGNNYIISNINLNGTGIFDTLHNATIQNLSLQSPVLNINANNADAGIVANSAMQAVVTNVHVRDAEINAFNGSNYVGGIVGRATQTNINTVSVLNEERHYSINNFGGIVGYMDGSSVNAAVATGSMKYATHFGGIASMVSADSKISNAHTSFDLLLPYVSGGIAAISHGNIEYCYVTGFAYGELSEIDYPRHDYEPIVYTNNGTINGCVEVTDTDGMTRTFFESMGYAYGDSADAPWKGDGLPILYFENEYEGVPSIDAEVECAIVYNGTMVIVANAQHVSLYNVQGQLLISNNTATLDTTGLASGVYIIVATNTQGERMTRKIVVR